MFDVTPSGRLIARGTIVQISPTVFASVDAAGQASFVQVLDGGCPAPNIEQLRTCVTKLLGHDNVLRVLKGETP